MTQGTTKFDPDQWMSKFFDDLEQLFVDDAKEEFLDLDGEVISLCGDYTELPPNHIRDLLDHMGEPGEFAYIGDYDDIENIADARSAAVHEALLVIGYEALTENDRSRAERECV